MATKEKYWEKPYLIILAKSHPEEAILDNCKLNTPGLQTGKNETEDACAAKGSGGSCAACSGRGGT